MQKPITCLYHRQRSFLLPARGLTRLFFYVPVPVSETLCGLPPPLSPMLSVAVRRPLAVGVKVTVIVQLACAATLESQVLVSLKSGEFGPVTLMAVMLSVEPPVLVRVNVLRTGLAHRDAIR